MSWFDTSGIANLAKSALKEAQKTIDKALDIKEEEGRTSQIQKDEQLNNFFATWGIKSIEGESESVGASTSVSSKEQEIRGIWGSFTGSFFDNPTPAEHGTRIIHGSEQIFNDKSSRRSLPITGDIAGETERGLTMQSLVQSEDVPLSPRQRQACGMSSVGKEKWNHTGDKRVNAKDEKRRYSASEIEGKEDKKLLTDPFSPVVRSAEDHEALEKLQSDHMLLSSSDREDNTAQHNLKRIRLWINRPSAVSSESDKKSSESVEILDSLSNTNTNCTTTPESEVTSPSISTNPTHHDANRNSDSVEILSDSLVTSPSSVEVIADSISDYDNSPVFLLSIDFTANSMEAVVHHEAGDSTPNVSRQASPISEESRKPCVSNVIGLLEHDSSVVTSNVSAIKTFTRGEIDKGAADSASVVPDLDELDEVSLAEDSYTSASETTVMTIMEATLQLIEATGKARQDLGDKREPDCCSDNATGTNQVLNTSLDLSKEKQRLHLPVEPITTQMIYKGEPIGENTSAFNVNELTCQSLEVNACIEPIRNKSQVEHSADYPEQYLILTDSSCEGTLIESSSEDNPTAKTNNAKIANATLTTSSYVQNMLADAMVEKGEIQLDPEPHRIDVHARANSPISSESRSDLVKIGSDQTSGQTSGDELETTTSSDIEIISSPNGDSSSTQSCQSPANLNLTKGAELLHRALKTRGHSRELSEISVGSDEANFEVEKLLRRTQEMTEILQVRESKLIDVSRMNMELHEQNMHLKKQLDSIEMRPEHNQELNRVTEDYTKRLCALEKKFQQTISERDSLREQVDSLRHEASVRLSSRELLSITAEKDGIIRELREEGEKLSKQQLQHSNIIKKLRAKEKENETLLKTQKEQLDEQTAELERLKRSLYAKEEIERAQIEAIHALTARVKKQESDILNLQEKLDNSLHKMDAYKTTHEAIKVDSVDVKIKLAIAEEELKKASENAEESCQLAAQVEELRLKLRQSEEAHVKNVESLKRENHQLLKRLEISEARNEELSESVTLATKPLLRQLEQLQSSFAVKMSNFSKQEKLTNDTIDELQSKLEALVTSERSLVEENLSFKKKLSLLEAQIKRTDNEKTQMDEALRKFRLQYEQLEGKHAHDRKMIEQVEKSYEEQLTELKREIQSLSHKLAVEKAATNAERRKNNAILEQQQGTDQESRLSPTLSIGRDSIGSTSSVWPTFNESLFESGAGRFPSVYDSLRAGGNSTSMIENLQAQVKQRDGEIQQLQWEISRRNNERDILNMELSSLTFKIEELTGKVSEVEALNESLDEIQTRYDALLQMYGEKIEETQELRLDLEDVKDMYKTQIDQLLKRDTAVNN